MYDQVKINCPENILLRLLGLNVLVTEEISSSHCSQELEEEKYILGDKVEEGEPPPKSNF